MRARLCYDRRKRGVRRAVDSRHRGHRVAGWKFAAQPGGHQQITLDASGSSHAWPDRSIVTYEWDFDWQWFDFDSDALTAEGRATVEEVAATLASLPGVRVEIAGHTDSVGEDEFNMDLSQRRAESVRNYLVELGLAAWTLRRWSALLS